MAKRNQAQINESILAGAGLSYEELFQTQDYLEKGGAPMVAKTGTWSQEGGLFSHGSSGDLYSTMNSNNIGSILEGGSEAIAANKKRKKEQLGIASQGFGLSSSILGGAGF